MTTTRYYDDFLLYYEKAKILQQTNLGQLPLGTKSGDPLMDNITIYDTVNRAFAGFSNAIQQLWYGSNNPKKHQTVDAYDGLHEIWERSTWIYVFLVHRLTGSGASFQHDHGFRNTILPTLAERCNDIDSMVDTIKQWNKPMYTTIGNQTPAFPKPVAGYLAGGKYYMCEYSPSMSREIMNWLNKTKLSGGKTTIRQVVDWCLDWNTEHGFKRFKFAFTAFAMDLAEYMPDLVDPTSHANYGKNALESLDLMYTPETGRPRNAAFYDKSMDHLCDAVEGLPYDVEDVLCDFVRAQENYIPKGYGHLGLDQIKYNSFDLHPTKHPSYAAHIAQFSRKLF